MYGQSVAYRLFSAYIYCLFKIANGLLVSKPLGGVFQVLAEPFIHFKTENYIDIILANHLSVIFKIFPMKNMNGLPTILLRTPG